MTRARTLAFAVAALAILAAAPTTQAQSVPASTPRPAPASWTSARSVLRVGDQITVLIDELTLAEADRGESAVRERDRDISLKGGSGTTSVGGNLRTGNDVSRNTRGSASLREHLATELSVRVTEVTSSGTARIEGTRKVMIDAHAQDVSVRGWIRTQDIGFDNTIESWRVADAEIRYLSNGALVKAGGIWSKLLDLVVP